MFMSVSNFITIKQQLVVKTEILHYKYIVYKQTGETYKTEQVYSTTSILYISRQGGQIHRRETHKRNQQRVARKDDM